MSMKRSGEIAIIGVGFELPSHLGNTNDLWQFLLDRRDATTEVPPDRWSIGHFYDPIDQTPGKTSMRWGNFLNHDSYDFEPLFFGISPREGMQMDFQQRLLLGVSWRLLENAALLPADLQGSRTGVFIGGFTQDHLILCGSPFMRAQIRDQFAATAASMTMLAARLAHVYGFQGPAMAIDTACSSSLVALAQACNGLLLGDCDVAIAGGVNFMLSPQTAMLMSKGHFLAKDGRSKSFDASADGYGRGEGCVLFALKRIEDAMRDGDDIRAVISGTGVNQDGRTAVITLPDADAQENLMKEVMRKAGVEPSQIAYVEAHGTGTPVGDPIEAKAIARAVGQHKAKGEDVVVGTIKANLGHTEAVAGALGVLKALLCLEHRQVPPQANLTELNPAIPFDEYRLAIPQDKPAFLPESEELYALVNSFGYGGTNAVALLRRPTLAEKENAQRKVAQKFRVKNVKATGFFKRIPLVLSAFSEKSLQGTAHNYAELIKSEAFTSWEELCFSAAAYRTRFRHRAVILPSAGGNEVEEALAAFEAFEKGEKHPALFVGDAVTDRKTKPVFVFSGMGPQWWGMGRQFLKKATGSVRRLAQECDKEFQEISGWSILKELARSEKESRIQETAISQPAIFLLQICLAEFFKQKGIEPGAVTGHSVGEVAAAYVSGALDLKNAVKVIYHRSRLQARLEGKGTMLAVGLSAESLKEAIEPFGHKVAIAAINAPESCTLAGEKESLESLAKDWEEKGIFTRFLRVELPYHSPFMEEIKTDLISSLADLESQEPHCPLYSTVTGQKWEENAPHDAAYWYQNAREPVQFLEVTRQLLKDEFPVFLEIAAHPVLASSIKISAEETRHTIAVCPSLRRKEDDQETLTAALINLTLGGAEPDWRWIMRPSRVALPPYVWCVENELWQEMEASRRDRLDLAIHPVLGTASLNSGRSWQANISAVIMPWLVDHRIDNITLFPAAAYIEAALAAHEQIESKAPAILEDLRLTAPLVLQEGSVPVVAWCFDADSRVLSFTSETIAYNGDWQVHGQVTLLQAAPWKKDQIDLEVVKQGLTRFEGPKIYEELAAHGMGYGPSFQTLTALYRGENISIGEVSLKEAEKSELENYFIHPALLDGAMHAMIGAFPLEGHNDSLFVPTEMRRVSYMGQKCKAVTVVVKPKYRSAERVEADLTLYDKEGEVVLEILGLKCRRLARAGHDEESRVGRLLLAPSWVMTERQMLLSEPLKIALIGEAGDLASRLETLLTECGADVLSYPSTEQDDLVTLLENDRKILELRSLIYLHDPDKNGEQSAIEAVQKALAFVNKIPTRTRHKRLPLIIVTHNAYHVPGYDELVSPAQRALTGFFRGVQSERIDLAIRSIDLPQILPEDMLEDLAAEFVTEAIEEDTVALRDEKRYVERLIKPNLNPEPAPVPFETLEGSQDGRLGIRLKPGSSGTLESLSWQAYEVPKPGPGEVVFRTTHAGLNFKDILKAMSLLPESVVEGTYNGDHLGMESIVEVVAVGEGVTKRKVGEKLLFIYPESFSLYRVCNVDGLDLCTIPLTEEILAYSEPAIVGAPLVYVTAWYVLLKLAHLEKGESVLIHAGAGGVGQAAIQIALMKGATIYATAGSEEKRDYLRKQGCAGVWDSRTLEFVDGIRKATNGRGVDVVLNSLPGEALTQSLHLVAPLGRFIEIGKRDIVEHRRLDLTPFNENLSFFSFDMDRLMPDERVGRSILTEIIDCARANKISFLPHTVFPASEVVEAFRFLASSKHIGKVILSFEDLSNVQARPMKKEPPKIKADGSYLITGGMGGFGLKTAEALLRQGAGALHLLGRRLPSQPEMQEALETLKETAKAFGVEVHIHLVDVTDKKAVKKLVKSVNASEKPLCGVFHAAGVVDDMIVANLTPESVERVMAPKVLGAEALDEATQGLELDYFVLYSSFTTEIGNPGQSSYIAANGWLNALAEKRRQKGETAIAVGWGAIGDVGMLVRNEAANRIFDVAGVKTIKAEKALSLLPALLRVDQPSLSIVDIDWSRAFGALTWLEGVARFAPVRQESRKGGLSDTLNILFSLPESERLDYVLARLKGQLGSVLQIDPETIGDGARLSELGIDSLAGVELQMAIRSEFGVDVSLVVLARNETIIEMARSLLRQAATLNASKTPLIGADDVSKEEG
ncbi:type I polyketide synthase [Aristophania vespae]|uniref:type I polyketide synthase n=1 Tax=Aristophania vespae TaxID=2697033 RepID=UPI00235198E3|nr:type I polyketide synthase [Aristophania vespae]UMM63944.1 Phthioceranic/hydroxyphthioceranic acid synthase [Aristophania vespae]